ncbi:MAG: hypothetical protein LQ337_007729 [Flavoplaca oasis]|nr:MAG: hypothetical protein LQ337_007729 [Flavoplaca oasis]
MGVKPPLPAPTESSTLQTSGDSVTGTDLATDLSRRTEKTSISIPEDGSPVTIATKKRRENRDRDREHTLTKASHHSQTSLLIEYFEGGKGPNVHSRPSVRVKVPPSAAKKVKDSNEHIQITKAATGRKPSYTRRISLGPKSTGEKRITESADEKSISSYNSAADDSNIGRGYPPVEIEVMKGESSDLSTSDVPAEKRYVNQTASEISSMPADSLLEGNGEYITPKRTRSRSISRDAVVDNNNTLKTPSRRRSRSLSKERLTQKVIEKLGSRPREVISEKRRSSGKVRSRSASKEHLIESSKTPRRKSSRHHQDEISQSGTESILTDISPKRRSGDQYSFRSSTSKSSINNPKLLETVEDAIRRLILPELTTLKQEQKMQQNRDKFDHDNRESFASSMSTPRIETARRVSTRASAPDVNPKLVLNRDEHNAGTVLSGDSIKGRKESRREKLAHSPSERSFEREVSEETVIRDDDKVHRKRSKDSPRLRDKGAGSPASGILTAAALKHHDSKSSVESREKRRRRRSKSHSRTGSIAGSTEEIFYKHDVPPMPMRSDIHSSELTRESILSKNTEEPASPSRDVQKNEIREVSRGSPREVLSPASRTPTRTPTRTPLSGKGFATHHSNHSRGDLSVHNSHSSRSLREEDRNSKSVEYGTVEAEESKPFAANDSLDQYDVYNSREDNAFGHRAHNRGLSPIQSVASFKEEDDVAHHNTLEAANSSGSLSSLDRRSKGNSGLSIKSLSSVASTNIARSNRPKGINLERSEEVLEQHEALRDSTVTQSASPSRDHTMDDWYDRQHEENDRYRESFLSSIDPRIDVKHLTNYTDDSMDMPNAQHVQDIGANPEYIHTPIAVESAVASLHDPSMLSVRSKFGNNSMTDSEAGQKEYQVRQGSVEDLRHERSFHSDKDAHVAATKHLSPQHSHGKVRHSPTESPRQSIAGSLDDHEQENVHLGASGLPVADDPIPEIGHIADSDSDLNTNPSIIQGPIGGVQHGSRDHWPYQETPPQATTQFAKRSNESSAQESLKAAAANFLSTAALAINGNAVVKEQSRDPSLNGSKQPTIEDEYEEDINHDEGHHDSYSQKSMGSPPLNKDKDEGYVSAQQPRSPGAFSAESMTRSPGIFADPGINITGGFIGDGDPFVGAGKHSRHLSGYSQGMPSPLYDSATGRGLDRIQSQDIVALMDHLTVRDAQRNARDTEILVTLVRSAAEMRNSFEDMKKFIAEQDDMIIEVGDKQHDRTVQKVIGGPRPQPSVAPRAPRRSSAEDEAYDELPKRKSVFKRALKGLGGRNSNDLARMEDMLIQLLGEVEELKTGQRVNHGNASFRPGSQDSHNNSSREVATNGYEPEGQASTGNNSAYFVNSPSRQPNAMRSSEGRRGSQNRVSTVLEGNEELDAYEQDVPDNQFENNNDLLTPTRQYPRAGSVPLATPPQVKAPTGAQSNEHTPKTGGTDKSRKHKSSSSSFFPKISRWSKTTISSDNNRNSRQAPRPLSEASRSGSDLNYNATEHYDPRGEDYDHQGDDRLRSNDSLANDPMTHSPRPRSPLVPSTISEDPKYQAHRNSMNLQHPQPRPGPTHRYQTQLESRAHDFGSPISPTSDTWGSNPSLARFAPVGPGNRHSGGIGGTGYLSPISDAGASETSAAEAVAPPRPPKVKDDGPLIPARPAKVTTLSQERLGPEGRYSTGSLGIEGGYGAKANGSPRSPSAAGNGTGVPQRKPTGPRPITSSGSYSPQRQR